MPFNYNITANSVDSHQSTAYWLCVVVPYTLQTSYNYNNTDPGSSFTQNSIAVEEDRLLLIDDDCIQWDVSTSKDSHVTNLSMRLMKSNTNYLDKMSGGDWVIFWAFNNYDDYNTVKTNVNQLKRANYFDYAPKFVGRISTIVKDKMTDNVGRRTVHYSVTCFGFVELDSNMYFNSLLNDLNYKDAATFFSVFQGILNPSQPGLGPLVQTQQIVPMLLKTCLGYGPSDLFKNQGLGSNSLTTTPNEAFLIPKTIAKLLLDPSVLQGDTVKTVGVTYADLLQMYVGIQSYTPSANSKANPKLAGFIPNVTSTISDNFYLATYPLTGWHTLVPLQFDNQTVWSVIQQYIAKPVNEIYTCMKMDPDGYVVPTVVCRQLAFSTNKFANDNTVTRFLDLPRWNIDDSCILNIRTGKSDVLRQNYMFMMPTNWDTSGLPFKETSFQFSQPVADSEDIKRSGLRPQIQSIGAVINLNEKGSSIQQGQGRFWNKLLADAYFSGHQRYSGTVTMRGIQRPICEGDNVVIENVIYHIEQLSHSGSIDTNGMKQFSTSLQLTMGISVDSDKDPDGLPVFPSENDDANLSTFGDF